MKKRLLSLVLCLVMVFSLLPFAGFAAESVTQPDSTVITNPDAVVDGTGNLHLSKTLAQNQDDGTYSINLESFATADVSTVTTTEKIPTDFIVIVDQSGSMATTDMVANTSSYQSAGTVNLEAAANGGYYYYDSTTGQYYQVYGRRGYMYYRYAANNYYADDLYGTSLFYYFSREVTTASGAYGYYYYDTTDGKYYPISMRVSGEALTGGFQYKCYFTYNKNGTAYKLRCEWNDTDYHSYRQVFGKRVTEVFGWQASHKITHDFYKRELGYNSLCYRDINGVEHVLETTGGMKRTEYFNYDSNDNIYAVTSLNGTSRMQYNGLYTANASGAKVKRLDALSVALNQFAQAVAEETDTFGAVDNRIAIVGFSSQNTSNGTYNNTELLTGSTISSSSNGYSFKEGEYYFPYKGANYAPATSGSNGGTNYNGPQYYSASGTTRVNNTHYAAALISANNGTAGTVNPDVTKGIKSITAYGGTKPEDGFDMALKVYQNRSNTKYTIRSGDQAGQEVERNKIVIFFTDGQPGMYPYSDQYAGANAVVQKAYDLKHYKNPGSNTEVPAAIFSIGVFSEADSNPLTYEDSNADSDSVYDFDYAKTYTNSGTSHYLFRYWLANDSSRYGDTPNDTIYDYMSVVSSNYPNATTFMDSSWTHNSTESWKDMTARVRGTAPQSNNYYRMASNQDTLVAAFEAAVTMINTNIDEQQTVTLDSTAILRDTVNTAALDVSGATYTARRVPIKYDNGNFTEDETRAATVIQGYENVPVPANGQISVDGFNYKDDRTSATNSEGWKLVVTISGLVPKQMGTQVDSNVGNAGIYGPSTEKPAVSIASPKLRTAGLAKTYVIDFNAPMTVAENTTKLGATAGTNGTFDFKQSTVTYKLKSDETMVGGANIALSGVDTAMVYGVPANSPVGTIAAWNKITTVPASSVYFDDSFTTAIPVGTGSGYNSAVQYVGTSPVEKDQSNKKGYEFTFTGTAIDVYASTVSSGGYVMATLYNVNADGTRGTQVGKGQMMKAQSNTERYNVPVISMSAGTSGTYMLVLQPAAGTTFNLDGIRVYNPVDNDVYTGDAATEADAVYLSLREALVKASDSDTVSLDETATDNQDALKGALFVDDATKLTQLVTATQEEVDGGQITITYVDQNGNTVDAGTPGARAMKQAYTSTFNAYKANSPKHEIYLEAPKAATATEPEKGGQAVIFQIDSSVKNGNVWVGLSAPDAGATLTNGNAKVEINGNEVPVTSAVDMYYPIKANYFGTDNSIKIENTGNVMISVTYLKITGVSSLADVQANADNLDIDSLNQTLQSKAFAPLSMRTVMLAANNGVDPDAVVDDPGNTEAPANTEEPGTTEPD